MIEMIQQIGKKIKPFGKVVAIASGGSYGERYYFLMKKDKSISMIPAKVIEKVD